MNQQYVESVEADAYRAKRQLVDTQSFITELANIAGAKTPQELMEFVRSKATPPEAPVEPEQVA